VVFERANVGGGRRVHIVHQKSHASIGHNPIAHYAVVDPFTAGLAYLDCQLSRQGGNAGRPGEQLGKPVKDDAIHIAEARAVAQMPDQTRASWGHFARQQSAAHVDTCVHYFFSSYSACAASFCGSK
jgi:hypothetical protein